MKNYIKGLRKHLLRVEARDAKGKAISIDNAVKKIIRLIVALRKKGKKAMFIGNGGSASIASHLATDFLKNAKIPALSFNDPSLITCLGNDLGYECVFQKPIEMLADKGDILFAISSSGKSKNILNAVRAAGERGCYVITLSGFSRDNPLRKSGDINFYVPSDSYGYVEVIHLAVCHCIADGI